MYTSWKFALTSLLSGFVSLRRCYILEIILLSEILYLAVANGWTLSLFLTMCQMVPSQCHDTIWDTLNVFYYFCHHSLIDLRKHTRVFVLIFEFFLAWKLLDCFLENILDVPIQGTALPMVEQEIGQLQVLLCVERLQVYLPQTLV